MERTTQETWSKRVGQWKSSGLTAAEFGRKLGVSEKSLRWWKWRLKSLGREWAKTKTQTPEGKRQCASPVSALTFVEMTAATRSERMEVVLASGTRVLLAPDFDATALARLLDALERRA
jgi:hypothetical protein